MSATTLPTATPLLTVPTVLGTAEVVSRKQWTREEYYRLAEQGWFEGQRVELIEGEIVTMPPPQSPEHYSGIELVRRALARVFGDGYWIRQQGALTVNDLSEPEPDICVVEGTVVDYSKSHPTTAVLVVEVAKTSLEFDRKLKPHLYAMARVGEYWVLDLVHHNLLVFRDPVVDDKAPGGHRYETMYTVDASETISPLARPDAMVRVRDMLPSVG